MLLAKSVEHIYFNNKDNICYSKASLLKQVKIDTVLKMDKQKAP